MTKPTLHIPQKDSPSTYLTVAAAIGDNRITVADSSIFQLDPNNLITRLTLGFDTATTETLEVDAYISGNQITLLSPLTHNWGIGTKVARVFTSNDLSEVHQYLGELNSDATDLSELVAELSTDVSVLTGDYNTEVAPILNLLSIVHQKRHIFRGAFLGNVVSEAQNIAIKSGTFNDLYLGDYWTINNIFYGIALLNKLSQPFVTYELDIQTIYNAANLKIGDVVRVVTDNGIDQNLVVQEISKNDLTGAPNDGKIILGHGTVDIGVIMKSFI